MASTTPPPDLEDRTCQAFDELRTVPWAWREASQPYRTAISAPSQAVGVSGSLVLALLPEGHAEVFTCVTCMEAGP
jgi:hypothetical protein